MTEATMERPALVREEKVRELCRHQFTDEEKLEIADKMAQEK